MATPDPFDPPAVHCRHLLVCRTVWYDPAKPDEGCSLGRLVVSLSPPPGVAGRFVAPRLFAFAQLFGTVGDYDVRVRLVEVTVDEYGDEQARPAGEWGPWLVPVSGLELVESHAFLLKEVPFDRPGAYDFQLWADGQDEPLAAERVQIRDVIEEGP